MNPGKPINVLHVMPQIGTGGAEHQLLELIRHSDPAVVCHQVFYYSDALDDVMLTRYRDVGVVFTRIQRSSKRPLRFLRDFSRAIRQAQPDIVHCWLVSGNFWGRLAAILAGVEIIVVAWRNCDLWKPLGMIICEKLTSHRVHHLANSQAGANYIAQKFHISPNRFAVVYNGIECEKYTIKANREDIFGELALPENCKIVTMVGRLNRQKNYPMLLRVAARCKQRDLPVRFMIVGHGEQEGVLKSLADNLGLVEMVSFLGVRQDVPQILAASDIFCYTSDWEGFPNALLEAMASGLPVVCTDFDGAQELVTGPEVGTVVGRNDIEAACKAIQHYLEDPAEASAKGKRARQFVETNFSMPVMIRNTVEFYQRLCHEED